VSLIPTPISYLIDCTDGGQSSSSGYSSSWFKQVEIGTQKRYGKIAIDMVLFCIGLALGDFSRYSWKISKAQRLAVKAYIAALRTNRRDQTSETLQNLLYALFTQDRGDSSRYTFTVYRFLILYSFREDGSLSKASVITQYISAIVFIGRGTIFKKIEQSMAYTNRGYFK